MCVCMCVCVCVLGGIILIGVGLEWFDFLKCGVFGGRGGGIGTDVQS